MYAMSKRRGNEREILDDLYRKGMVGTGLKEKTFFKEMVLKSPQTLDWRRPKLPFHVPLASVLKVALLFIQNIFPVLIG